MSLAEVTVFGADPLSKQIIMKDLHMHTASLTNDQADLLRAGPLIEYYEFCRKIPSFVGHVVGHDSEFSSLRKQLQTRYTEIHREEFKQYYNF